MMQNTIGKLLERKVARILEHKLEEKEVLPPTFGNYPRGKDNLNKRSSSSSQYSQRVRETGAVITLDLKDGYNRMQ